ncbi:MAG: hypothetical protein ACREQW_20595 [Candidatus Binatia bacterium]
MKASRVFDKQDDIAGAAGCARALRVIGQALEDLEIEHFNLECAGREFAVHGEARALAPSLVRIKIKMFWRNLQDRYLGAENSRERSSQPRQSAHFSYTHEDIDRLDQEHKTRGLAEENKPDLYGLPEMLRLVGNYVDRKGHLVRVSRFGRQLSIHYVTDRGETKIEEHDVAALYDLSVHMYLKRSER